MDYGNGEGSSIGQIYPLENPGTTTSFMRRRKPGKLSRKKLIGIVLAILIFTYLFIIRPVSNIRAKANEVTASAKELKYAFSQNDMNLVQIKLDTFSKKYNSLEKEARGIYWLVFIPYVSDLKNGIEAGRFAIEAGKEAVTAISPYADLIGFKKGGVSFVEKSAEDRLQTAVLTLDKVLTRIDAVSDNIRKAEERMNKIDPQRYPEKIGKTHVRGQIQNVKDQFYGISSLFVDAKPLLKQLPEILGKDGEKTYLILFQNNYERRATGGFLTSYAFFKIKDGRMKIERSEDIYSLDNSISSHPSAPKEILTFHKGVNQFFIRDSNLSPDLLESIKLFEGLYRRSSVDVDYDGIILLDSKVLVDMLKIFGDTEADGVVFTANEDKRCDCPQVIYTLFDIVDRPVNYVKTDRKGILGDLMYALFYKAVGFSPSKYWGTLAQTMFSNLEEKHILLYFKDKSLQQAAENINFAGRIRPFEGDYLHVSGVNFAGAKSNLFIDETIESKTKISSSGHIEKEVVLTYKNPYSHSDCNLERGGLCLNAVLRNWLRVYVPEGSKLESFNGSQRAVRTYNSLGKTVFEGFMTVSPEGRSQVTITYTLPDSITKQNYQYMIQKQPGVENDKQDLKVTIGGARVFDGPFVKDKIFKKSL